MNMQSHHIQTGLRRTSPGISSILINKNTHPLSPEPTEGFTMNSN